MNFLQTGQFFGETDRTFELGGITLTDTEYTVERVDWHYHENPYFTFIIDGRIIEGNKDRTYSCRAGSLLFHNWQEPHYNVKPPGYTRGFQIEAEASWFSSFCFDIKTLPGYVNIEDPEIKILFHKVYSETLLFGHETNLAIEGLLLEVLHRLGRIGHISESRKPMWVERLNEILRDELTAELNLSRLSTLLDLHPGYLCRAFRKFNGCGFGEYIRKLRVERALVLLRQTQLSLTEISAACGFADQSHFIRCFRAHLGSSPKSYRNLLRR